MSSEALADLHKLNRKVHCSQTQSHKDLHVHVTAMYISSSHTHMQAAVDRSA